MKTRSKLILYFFNLLGYQPPIKLSSPLRKVISLLAHDHDLSSRGITYFDIGANKGQELVEFALLCKRYKIRSTAYAFEPVKANFELLKKTIKELKIEAHAYNYGLSNSDKVFTLNLAPNSEHHSISNNEHYNRPGAKIEEIKIRKFDNIFSSLTITGLTVIKIDVEGHEISVLEGMAYFIQRVKPVAFIVEVGFNREDLQHTDFTIVSSFLLQYGYRCVDIQDICAWKSASWGGGFSIGFANSVFMRSFH